MHRLQGRLILYLGAIVALLSLHSTLPRFDVLTDEAILVQGPLSRHPGYRRGGEEADGDRREVFRMPVKLSGGPEHLVKYTILDVKGTGVTEIQTGFRIQDENRVFHTRVDDQVRGKKVVGVIRPAESLQVAIFRVLMDPAFTITLADVSLGSFNFAGRMLRWGARLGAVILWAVIILELLVASRVVGSALLCASALVGFLYLVYPQPFFTGRGDTQWNVPLALSILHEGDMDLNEYAAEIRHQKVGAAKHLGGEWRL